MSEIIALGLEAEEMPERRWVRFRYYLGQQPVMLALLSLLLVLFFVFVTGLSRAYYAQRAALGERWFTRGVADLNAKNFTAAVTEFRAALLYAPDNYSYQLNLAEALLGLGKHTAGEAAAYLLNLWDREPDDGVVNLELARIAAQQQQIDDAIRYYHGAVYAAWSKDQESMRHQARLELIELLLRINAKPQAQSELIALEANAGEDAAEQEQIGDLFLRAQDYEHALAAYRTSLRGERHNASDLAGAGYAAFELGRYPLAQHYLKAALTDNPKDTQTAERLKMTEMVLHMDPFGVQIPAAERDRMVVEAFAIAGERLKNCAVSKSASPAQGTGVVATQPSLHDEWNSLKPEITPERLARHPDLVGSAMDLVFRIERQSAIVCGTPTGTDGALLLIGKLHEGT